MEKKEQTMNRHGKIEIDTGLFDPVLDSASKIRAELEDLLKNMSPEEVHLQLPEDYANYSAVYRCVILPFVIIKSGELGYRVFLDDISYNIAFRVFGKHLSGDKTTGYSFPE